MTALRFAAVDVGYAGDGALAAAVLFSEWEQAEAEGAHTAQIRKVAPYEPGQFYLRELPCILAVLQKLRSLPDLILVDGYVWLDPQWRPGLGARLHHALRRRCAVVGVAKSRFFIGSNVAELTRGRSRRPLFVTSIGVDLQQAARGVGRMHGNHRIPTLLGVADRLSRDPEVLPAYRGAK